jgi:hypothetical protein
MLKYLLDGIRVSKPQSSEMLQAVFFMLVLIVVIAVLVLIQIQIH